ncbi:MAG TPA: extracellular solute-binding protein [Polyangia bacterium]
MSLIDKYPYGKAPFVLLVIAIVSVGLRVVTARRHDERPDLVIVTHTDAHYESYRKAIPRFEREHGVKVQLQLVNWASLQARLQNSILAGTEVPDLAELFEGSMGYFTRGPAEDFGVMDLTDLLKRDGLYDRMVQSRFSLWSARGRIYGLPHDVHPVMLAYRRDLVQQLGIDVSQLDTWEKFVEVGRRISRDVDGDGVVDHYMIDLRFDGNWGLDTLMLQRGGQFFDPQGNVAFATEDTAELIRWYILQTRGPNKIGYDCGWGQPVAKAMIDGLVVFQWTPDWRSWVFEDEVPSLKGKMALMPMPAWTPGGRRTSVWGGTGLMLMKASKHPELAWELAKFLYFDAPELGKRFQATNIIPVLKDAWNLPEFEQPNPYWSNLPIGKMYAALAPETPPLYSSPVDAQARTQLDLAYAHSVEHYTKHGEAGLMEAIRAALATAAANVRRYADRESKLREAKL